MARTAQCGRSAMLHSVPTRFFFNDVPKIRLNDAGCQFTDFEDSRLMGLVEGQASQSGSQKIGQLLAGRASLVTTVSK